MADNLDYLTVDQMEWSNGAPRPRMTPSERRLKHRMHQQEFMARERKRVADLRVVEALLTLQLRLLQAIQTGRDLTNENYALQHQLVARASRYHAQRDADDELEVMVAWCRMLFLD